MYLDISNFFDKYLLKHDNLPFLPSRTRHGKDVSTAANKFNLIGDSYAVEKVENGPHTCQPAPPQPETFCTSELVKRQMDDSKLCGALIDTSGPFGACLAKHKKEAEQLHESCIIDLCANAKDEKALKRSKCEIFKVGGTFL
ncbi:unnamed protein product [Protopolystoma xenopodis]|uniref:Uncharacterized protein n=1 Tax=Protopolystoma xenopodis TaxID=117903 RepID=A0A448X368_9PLAT|nr:unnamed protein product [Protopolystoma xenopodis]